MTAEAKNIAEVLQREYGMDISMYDDTFLIKSLERRVAAIGSHSFREYCETLKTDRAEALSFFDSLHITFSEFFRNPLTFAYLEQLILPALIEKKKKRNDKEIRVWSAACAAGQETYSIAMLLDELMADPRTNIACRIFASDSSPDELTKAQRGVYHASSLHKVTLKRIHTYFTRQGETYSIAAKLRDHVDFSLFDLSMDRAVCPPASIYGNFDLLFCCNILYYYKPECRRIIFEKIAHCLASGGYLIAGETERDIAKQYNFHELFAASAIFQRNGLKGEITT